MTTKLAPVIAFMDLLGTTYYAQTDRVRYRENLFEFKEALITRASVLKGYGSVYFFSDCAYLASSSMHKLIQYLTEVRRYLLLRHLYIQAAIEPGELSPLEAGAGGEKVVQGTIFGEDVAAVYARQHALKGAAVRVSDTLISSGQAGDACVRSCHLPNPTNSTAECFWDIRYPKGDVDRRLLEDVLADCLKAKSVRRSAGIYYLSVLVSMVRSVNWASVDLRKTAYENNNGARHIYELFIKGEFSRHFGDLRGSEYVFFAILDEVYSQCEHKEVCKEVAGYIASRPRLLRKIEAVPAGLLGHQNRHKFLESTLDWAHLAEQEAPSTRKVRRGVRRN